MCKQSDALPRFWRAVEGKAADKARRFYKHESALLSRFPLSEASKAIKASYAVPREKTLTLEECRKQMLTLPKEDRTASRFKRHQSGKWIVLNAATLTTYYEDRVLHSVGRQRMAEWHAGCGLTCDADGCALAFWHNLDGGPSLPDAITAGLESTVIAEFEA